MKKRLVLLLSGVLLLSCSACRAGPEPSPAVSSAPAPVQTQTAPPTPTPAGEGGGVHTDWSHYTPRQPGDGVEERYTRWYEAYTADLPPLEAGYGGPLLAYPGPAVRSGNWGVYSRRMGLMTAGGVLVTDPEFTRVKYLGPEPGAPTLMLLAKGFGRYLEEYEYTAVDERYAVADLEGRWVTDYLYDYYITSGDGVFLAGDGGCVLLDWTGAQISAWTWAELGYPEGDRGHWEFDMAQGWNDGILTLSGRRYLDTRTGRAFDLSGKCDYSRNYSEGLCCGAELNEPYREGYLDADGNWAIPPQYSGAGDFHGGRAVVTLDDGTSAIIDLEGNILLRGKDFAPLPTGDGRWWYVETGYYNNTGAWTVLAAYGPDLEPLDCPLAGAKGISMPSDLGDWEANGWVCGVTGGQAVFYRNGETVSVREPAVTDCGYTSADGLLLLTVGRDLQMLCELSTGAVLARDLRYPYVSFGRDELTGEVYLTAEDGDRVMYLLDLTGAVLAETEPPEYIYEYDTGGTDSPILMGGLVRTVTEDAAYFHTPSGELVFCKRTGYPAWED